MRAIRCMVGLHVGQERGGTMMYTCPRCGGSFWQKRDYSAVTAAADRLVQEGRGDDALDLVRRELGRRS